MHVVLVATVRRQIFIHEMSLTFIQVTNLPDPFEHFLKINVVSLIFLFFLCTFIFDF